MDSPGERVRNVNSKNKGSSFERDICRQLSLWWTADLPTLRDDCFWRTSNSGGRATVRGKKKQTTSGHYGDICATDSVGEDLLKVVTIELKRGYNKHSLFDLIDKPAKAAKQEWEKWIEQAIASSILAKTKYWMIISRRDRRETLVTIPTGLLIKGTIPLVSILISNNIFHDEMKTVRLSQFLNDRNRDWIKILSKSNAG